MTLRLRFNGLDHAFLSEFGCTCGRCTSAVRRANTSVSLLELSEGNQDVKQHILFDVGMGVTDSLVTSPLPSSATRLDGMVVSHWHPDHAIEMNRLCESWLRSRQRRQEEPGKVRIWCRQGTANWLERLYPYEWNHLLAPVVLPGDYPPRDCPGGYRCRCERRRGDSDICIPRHSRFRCRVSPAPPMLSRIRASPCQDQGCPAVGH